MVERPEMQIKLKRFGVGKWLPAISLVAVLLLSAMASAQVLYGTLTGTVTDKSGAVVPKLAVTLTNQSTGEVRSAVTNSVGEYRFGDVCPALMRFQCRALKISPLLLKTASPST